ncbi:uncharacterized protein LOC125371724 [Haliotis rufescens]|uniref:uncharacterized protein LOC125371724 n=1 Tax=Haliotis rufescens TaxID=6454 RepID=UPI00201EC3DD|nr:uncharacterized protein LOC125371724 [Haliotis rufescens]
MANTQLSGGAVMGHHLPLLLFLSLEAWFSSAFGQNTCGQFSYHLHQGLDDQTFDQDALLVKVYTAEKALTECSSDCFRHPSCNMFVLNPTSGECRRFKRAFFDLTHAISAPGFKYYAANCLFYKSSVCQDGFSLYPGTGPADSHCFSAGVWVQQSGSSHVCKQDEWIDTTENSIPLPAPIVPGVIIDIRGSKSSNVE